MLKPNDLDSYYKSRELVPADMLADIDRAKIVITNYHAFKLRERLEVAKGTRTALEGWRGEKLQTLETEGQMLQRVMPELMGMKNIVVLNDEAHHCYRERVRDAVGETEADLKGEDKDEAKNELIELHSRIDALQQRLAAEHTQALLVVLQAMDACGKDGTIRSVFGALNPAGVKVSSFKAPAGHEVDHDYLWRVHSVVPGRGEIGVWNRSHYEDVLVVRVKNLVSRERWERRYRHIREFERLL